MSSLPERREPPAPLEHILQALQGLASNTRHRGMSSPQAMAAGAERMARMLLEFPGHIALKAIDRWPYEAEGDDGEWFPTEKGLHTFAAVLMREHQAREARAAAARTSSEGRYMSPLGNTELYVEKVERVHGKKYVEAWLQGGINAQFTPGVVYLTGAGYDRLTADTWHQAKEADVKLRACPRVSELLAAYCDKLELDGRVQPKKRKSGGWE